MAAFTSALRPPPHAFPVSPADPKHLPVAGSAAEDGVSDHSVVTSTQPEPALPLSPHLKSDSAAASDAAAVVAPEASAEAAEIMAPAGTTLVAGPASNHRAQEQSRPVQASPPTRPDSPPPPPPPREHPSNCVGAAGERQGYCDVRVTVVWPEMAMQVRDCPGSTTPSMTRTRPPRPAAARFQAWLQRQSSLAVCRGVDGRIVPAAFLCVSCRPAIIHLIFCSFWLPVVAFSAAESRAVWAPGMIIRSRAPSTVVLLCW